MFLSMFIIISSSSAFKRFVFASILSFNNLKSFIEPFSICSTSPISFSFNTDFANSFKSNSTSQDFPSDIFLIEKALIKLLIFSSFSMFSKILETDSSKISSASITTRKSGSKLSSL